jgi:hypothetical protein
MRLASEKKPADVHLQVALQRDRNNSHDRNTVPRHTVNSFNLQRATKDGITDLDIIKE